MRIRGLVAALYLMALPGPGVWAQVARVSLSRGSVPLRFAPSLAGTSGGARDRLGRLTTVIPGTVPSPSVPGPGSIGVRPALGAPAVPIPAAPVLPGAEESIEKTLGVVEAAARFPAPTAAEASAPAARILEVAALDAAEVSIRPGSAEGDSSRVDFTLNGGLASGDSEVLLSGGDAPEFLGRSEPKWGGSPSRAPPERGKLKAYLGGTFMTQLAHGGLMVTLPLVLMQITASLSAVSIVSAVATGMDAVGTLIGGRLGRKFSPRALLIGANLARAAALMMIPAALAFGALTIPVAGAVYAADSLARGVADTAANTAPMALVGKSKDALDGTNARIQAAMEAGSVVGPLVVGGLLLLGKAAAAYVVPFAFIVTAVIYLWMPKARAAPEEASLAARAKTKPRIMAWGAIRALKTDRMLMAAFVGTIAFNLFSLRGLLPAFFAGSFLNDADLTPWLAAACGLGGAAAAFVYHRMHRKLGTAAWLRWGALGIGALALGWLPGNFLVMIATFFAFALGNVVTRLAMASVIQSRIPKGEESSVMGLLRFTGSIASTAIKLVVGLVFAVASTAWSGFLILGGLLVAAALAQMTLSGKMARLEEKAAPRRTPGAGLSPDP